MHDDDQTRGLIMSRRQTLQLLGGSGLLMLGGSLPAFANSSPATVCVARPQQTEGPYFVDDVLQRADLRTDAASGEPIAGAPFELRFFVGQLHNGQCAPLANAKVDLWHCDAQGVYSSVQDWRRDTRSQQFLRGYQLTDQQGMAKFFTIFPGWYPGRTVHFHFKIRSGPQHRQEFTSQLYFDDGLIDKIFAQAPYNARGERRTRNTQDGIFRRSGEQLLLTPQATAKGYVATFAVGLLMD